MSHSQFHCTGRVYLDLHGLIFETSICYWQDQPGSPPFVAPCPARHKHALPWPAPGVCLPACMQCGGGLAIDRQGWVTASAGRVGGWTLTLRLRPPPHPGLLLLLLGEAGWDLGLSPFFHCLHTPGGFENHSAHRRLRHACLVGLGQAAQGTWGVAAADRPTRRRAPLVGTTRADGASRSRYRTGSGPEEWWQGAGAARQGGPELRYPPLGRALEASP